MPARERPWSSPFPDLLGVTPTGEDRFAAQLDGFGGITLACALLATARTAAPLPLHSFHAYFLRAVPTERPAEIVVERLRDGRRFRHRRTRVGDGARAACELVASFAVAGEGIEAQDLGIPPGTPAPEALPSDREVLLDDGRAEEELGPLEWRWIGPPPWFETTPQPSSEYRAWVRPRYALPDEHAWHAAALAFLADYHSHMSVARWLGGFSEGRLYTSLDQSVWLHRDIPWNDWWLVHTEGVVAHGGRALTRRTLHARDGRLVASMAQEQLIPG